MNKINNYIYFIQNNRMENNTFILINDKKECYVVDPSWNGNEIVDFIKTNQFEYKGMIMTHLHFDHTADMNIISTAFNNNNIYCSKDGEVEIESGTREIFIGKHIENKDYKFNFVDENFKLTDFKLSFILTPGHSKSSMCIYYENCLITGDCLFIDSIGRTDLQFSEPVVMLSSLNKLKNFMKNKDDVLIMPGHGEFAKWKQVKEINFMIQ